MKPNLKIQIPQKKEANTDVTENKARKVFRFYLWFISVEMSISLMRSSIAIIATLFISIFSTFQDKFTLFRINIHGLWISMYFAENNQQTK